MKNPFAKSVVAAIETEIANLDTRRATLDQRREKANALFEASRSARKGALAADPTADLSKLTGAVRDAEDEVETLDGVLNDLAEQRRDAEARLEAARDVEMRKAAAKTLTDTAAKFDAGAIELAQAIDALAAAARKMMVMLPDTLHVAEFGDRLPEGQSEAERIVATIVAEGIASAVPSLMPVRYWAARDGHVASLGRAYRLASDYIVTSASTDDLAAPALDTRAAARAVVTDRLRQRADRIVAGEASPDLADREPWSPEPVVAVIPTVEVIAIESFRFKLEPHSASQIVTSGWPQQIPEDAADVAVAAGIALRTDTEAGAKAFAAEKARRSGMQQIGSVTVRHSECVDIGVIRKEPDDETDIAAAA